MTVAGEQDAGEEHEYRPWNRLPAELRAKIAEDILKESAARVHIGKFSTKANAENGVFNEPGILSVDRITRRELRGYFYDADVRTLHTELNLTPPSASHITVSNLLLRVQHAKDAFEQKTPATLQLIISIDSSYPEKLPVKLSPLAIIPRLVCSMDFPPISGRPTLELMLRDVCSCNVGKVMAHEYVVRALKKLRDDAQSWKAEGLTAVQIEKKTLTWLYSYEDDDRAIQSVKRDLKIVWGLPAVITEIDCIYQNLSREQAQRAIHLEE